MKKVIILCVVVITVLFVRILTQIPEPGQCALCDDMSYHAPCIVNLSTGEKLELDIYDPHPFLVGEVAEEQRGGYFSFVRGAGVEGYKLGAESVTITIPIKSPRMDQKFFCNNCRECLNDYKKCGYILVDLKDPDKPVVYEIDPATSVSVRCYDIAVQEDRENGKYKIVIIGTLE